MTSNSFNYLICFKPAEEQPSIKKTITVVDQSSIPASTRRKLIAKIIKVEEATGKDLSKITITAWNEHDRTLDYQIKDEAKTLSNITFGTETANIQVIPSLSKDERVTYGEIWTKGFSGWRALLGLGFIYLIVHSIWAGWRVYHLSSEEEQELNRLLDGKLASQPEGFLEVLRATARILEEEGVAGGGDFSEQLEKAVDHGTQFLECAQGKGKISDFLDKLLMPELKADQDCLLPAGYYIGTDYQPALLAIRKTADKITVKKYSLDALSGHTGKLAPLQEFEITGDDHEEKFKNFIKYLASIQQPQRPSAISEEDAQKRGLIILHGGAQAGAPQVAPPQDQIATGLTTHGAVEHVTSTSVPKTARV